MKEVLEELPKRGIMCRTGHALSQSMQNAGGGNVKKARRGAAGREMGCSNRRNVI